VLGRLEHLEQEEVMDVMFLLFRQRAQDGRIAALEDADDELVELFPLDFVRSSRFATIGEAVVGRHTEREIF